MASSTKSGKPGLWARSKITADELAWRWEDGAARREQVRSRYLTGAAVRGTLAGVLLLAAAGTAVAGRVSASGDEETMAAQASQIATLESQNELAAQQAAAAPKESDAGATMASAQQAGAEVARLQNVYRDIKPTAPGATPRKGEATSASTAAAMGKLLAKEAQGARVPWFVADGQSRRSTSAPLYSWSFLPGYTFSQKTVDVVWLARRTDDAAVLAFATATYDPATKTFSKVVWGQTEAGRKAVGSEQSGGSPQDQADAEALEETGSINGPGAALPTTAPTIVAPDAGGSDDPADAPTGAGR